MHRKLLILLTITSLLTGTYYGCSNTTKTEELIPTPNTTEAKIPVEKEEVTKIEPRQEEPKAYKEEVIPFPRISFPEFGSSKTYSLTKLREDFVTHDNSRNRTNLVNTSYPELLTFLQNDKTNEVNWGQLYPNAGCTYSAINLRKEANKVGIRAAVVVVEWTEQGHALNTFETTDRGILWVEPQTDQLQLPVAIPEDIYPNWINQEHIIKLKLTFVIYIW